MRKIYLLTLLSLLMTGLFGQRPRTSAPTSVVQVKSVKPEMERLNRFHESSMMSATQLPVSGHIIHPGKTTTISPTQLGTSSNCFSSMRTSQNNVYANDSLDLVAYIHRQNVTVFGGGSTANGKFRYDFSVDGGMTYTNDIGALQTAYTNYGRYPMLTGLNPGNSSNPFDSKLAYAGATNRYPTPGWVGHVYGVTNVTSGTVTATENYKWDGENIVIPGGLIQSSPGTLWCAEYQYDNANSVVLDSFYVYKGIYGNNDVNWTRHKRLFPNHNTAYDGSIVTYPPDMAASLDGQTIWLAWLGDVVGGHDSVLTPCFMKSTDGGNTWGNSIEVDLRTIGWIKDSLQTLWGDSLGNPIGDGRPTCTNGFDVTVDDEGTIHMFTILANGSANDSLPGYVIYPGLAKLAVDIFSTDGGTTWDAAYVAPVLGWQGEAGHNANGDFLTITNHPQISRTQDGSHVFYSWADIDTITLGFGETDMSLPNLRIAGYRTTDGYRTCWKRISDNDAVWDGQVMFPSMAPTALTVGGSTYKLPIVFLDILTDQDGPCNYWYLGNDAQIFESDFQDPSLLNLSYDGGCLPVGIVNPVPVNGSRIISLYPNPTNANSTIRFALDKSGETRVAAFDIFGNKVWENEAAQLGAGSHEISLPTAGLAQGVYFISVLSGNDRMTQRLVVQK